MTQLKIDPGTNEESPEAAEDAKKHEAQLAGFDLQERKDDLDNRRNFSSISLGIMQSWVGFIIVLTLAQFILKPIGLGLESSEFIAVVTSTTAAVFGFGLLVGNYLFPLGGSNRALHRK